MIDYDAHSWWRHFFDIKGSTLREIVVRVAAVVAWSIVVVAVHKLAAPVGVPATVHALVGVALGLLLVFRTNSSYDRFWEGRKQWGGIVNETRNLARQSRSWLKAAPELHRELVLWTAAFPYAAMHSLRGATGIGPLRGELPAADVEAVIGAQHTPLAVSLRMSDRIAEARRRGLISDQAHVALDANVQQLVDYLGACERIHRTPLPFAYVVHLRRALILYTTTLPFALVDPFGWFTVPATFLIAYTFFGIEEIGVEIEDPFGEDDNDLPIERICGTIYANLKALVD